jgi:glutamate-ammonia-ligase adenylyltransferase
MLADLCRGAEDLDPILHSFKNSLHLRVGVRDILGKEDIRATTAALSDVAEVCLDEIARQEYQHLVDKYGQPSAEDANALRSGQRVQARVSHAADAADQSDLVILAMGKFGGREPNYHSDLDIIFVYEFDGMTRHDSRAQRHETTTNQHFFSELGQRIIKFVNQLGPHGRLYELDPRLRPTGKSGALAVSVEEFSKYFAEGQGQLWERQALCRARPVFGSPRARARVIEAVRRAIIEPAWQPENAQEIHRMRLRLEETASDRNIKRGRGGTVDIEFAVQLLQLRHAADNPQVVVPSTFEALDALRQAGYLLEDDHNYFSKSYRFLRSVEARLRLMNTAARHDLPESDADWAKLAYLLGRPDCHSLLADCRRYTSENRTRFERLFASAS